jgi:chemotaxis signal transduction protein
MWQPSDPTAPGTSAAELHVRAGGRRLALPFEVTSGVGPVVPWVRVPRCAPWLLGLIQWRGGLLTLVDAGVLFGERPCRPTRLVVLRGLKVDVALAVDEILRPADAAQPADLLLDHAALAGHPALQPGGAIA